MKTFLRFISEAPDSNKAKEQARKLNLKSDGHGGWLDSKGEFVAKTAGGKLRFYNQRQRAGQDPPQPKVLILQLLLKDHQQEHKHKHQ